MYRVYARDAHQKVLEDTKTNTHSREVAQAAFANLIARPDLAGQKIVAILSYKNGQLAAHRFDHPSGTAQDWRGRLDEIEWPEVGRPAEMEGGKRVNVYLDAESLAIASAIGDGNVSEGIRIALGRQSGNVRGKAE